LLKRAREVVFGLPALIVWSWLDGFGRPARVSGPDANHRSQA
jgi:hypothetical protein